MDYLFTLQCLVFLSVKWVNSTYLIGCVCVCVFNELINVHQLEKCLAHNNNKKSDITIMF